MKFKKMSGIIIAAALLMSGCSGNSVAMQIGDKTVTEGAVKFVAEYGLNSSDINSAAEFIQKNYLVNEIAEKMDLTLSEDEQKDITSAVASFKSQLGGKSAADKILKEYGIDDDVLTEILATSTYSQKVFDEISSDEPTDDELKQFFKDKYLRAKHVLISTIDQTTGEEFDEEQIAEAEEKANEILARAQSGEDFDSLIAEFNEDPGMESNPDGYFFTDDEMVQSFEDATKSIQPGEFAICKSDFGYHVIQRLPLDETTENFETFFEDNKSSVQSSITLEKQLEALDKKAEELGIQITVNQEVIDSITLDTQEE